MNRYLSDFTLGNPTTTELLPPLRFAEQEVNAIAFLYNTQALVPLPWKSRIQKSKPSGRVSMGRDAGSQTRRGQKTYIASVPVALKGSFISAVLY